MYLVCGEALYDFFQESGGPAGELRFEARPGGSPFNVAIGVARLGGRAALLTALSRDMLGERLMRILEREGVCTDYVLRCGGATVLSLVGMNRKREPQYSFYGLDAAGSGLAPEDIPEPGPGIAGLHFGSYSMVAGPMAEACAALAESAGDRFISIDPNVRTMVEPDPGVWRERIGRYARRADLVRVSMEDLRAVYPDLAPEAVAVGWLAEGVRLAVVTDGGGGVQAWSSKAFTVRVEPPDVPVVDSVGAGDSFQAALLTGLAEEGGGDPGAALDALDEGRLERLLHFAIGAAQLTCRRRGADLPRRRELRYLPI